MFRTACYVVRLACCLALLVMVACQPAAPTSTDEIAMQTPAPVDEFARYYGEKPPAATLAINGQSQISGVGTSTWIASKSGGRTAEIHGDALGFVTPAQPLILRSPFTATLQLPVHTPPTNLSYRGMAVTLEDRHGPPGSTGMVSWRAKWLPSIPLPREQRQDIALDLEPGAYILVVFAEWEPLGSVDYGFYFEVQD